MNQWAEINLVLRTVSLITLGGLVIFQLLHFVVGSWRFWKESSNRTLYTFGVGIFWISYGVFFVSNVVSTNSYVEAIPYVLLGLYLPSFLALVLMAFSKNIRKFVDKVSLKWAIQSVEGPARMIVGIIFLFWYFAGQLPGIVAWVAGPGDWIAGFISFYAVGRLKVFSNLAKIKDANWSVADYMDRRPEIVSVQQLKKLKRHLRIAIGLVAFGIIDFIMAPASTAVSIALGNIPEEMGRIPLTLIPLVLVPQVLLLEIFAMRQLFQLNRSLKHTT